MTEQRSVPGAEWVQGCQLAGAVSPCTRAARSMASSPTPSRCFMEGSAGISYERNRSTLEVRVTNAQPMAWGCRKGIVFTFSRSACLTRLQELQSDSASSPDNLTWCARAASTWPSVNHAITNGSFLYLKQNNYILWISLLPLIRKIMFSCTESCKCFMIRRILQSTRSKNLWEKKISSADVNQCDCTEIIWGSVPLYLYSPFLQYLYSSVYLNNGQTLK